MMQGRRKQLTLDDTKLAPGEYGKRPDNESIWWCCTPNGHYGNLGGHDVTEHEDGTITVSPSIAVTYGDREVWHGFLERGVWREV